MLAEGDGAGGDNERDTSAPGGVLNHGTCVVAGPVTRETHGRCNDVEEHVTETAGGSEESEARTRSAVQLAGVPD